MADYYQLQVSLKGSKPKIWRRFIVPATIRLPQFHEVLQIVMGWYNCHLHEFIHQGQSYSDPETAEECDIFIEDKVPLNKLLVRPKDKLEYIYDFGDGWQHQVVLEKIVPAPKGQKYLCVKGVLNCPIEDSGGLWGYYEKLDLLKRGKAEDEDEEAILEWIGEGFDPESFDLEWVNEQLRGLQ